MAVDHANDLLAEAKADVIESLRELDKKSTTQRRDGKRLTFTVARKTATKIDESGLRRALGAKAFDKFTEKKLVKKKLEEAVEIGEVDALMVAKYVTVSQGDPYVTYTEKEEDDG